MVMSSAVRFVILLLSYGLLGLQHWLPVAVRIILMRIIIIILHLSYPIYILHFCCVNFQLTTASTCAFLLVKVFLFKVFIFSYWDARVSLFNGMRLKADDGSVILSVLIPWFFSGTVYQFLLILSC
jgi:hypothetical protein